MTIVTIHINEDRVLLKADSKPLLYTANSHTSIPHIEVPVVDTAIVAHERDKVEAAPKHQASVPVFASSRAARHTDASGPWHRERDHEQAARSWNYELGEFIKDKPQQS